MAWHQETVAAQRASAEKTPQIDETYATTRRTGWQKARLCRAIILPPPGNNAWAVPLSAVLGGFVC
jgi:hypothetical protein